MCAHSFWGLKQQSLSVRCPRRVSPQNSSRSTKTSSIYPSLWWPPTPPVYCCLHLACGNAGTSLSVRTTHAAAASWFAKTWRAVSNTSVSICYDKSADIIATWSKFKVSIYIKDKSNTFGKKKKNKKFFVMLCSSHPVLNRNSGWSLGKADFRFCCRAKISCNLCNFIEFSK